MFTLNKYTNHTSNDYDKQKEPKLYKLWYHYKKQEFENRSQRKPSYWQVFLCFLTVVRQLELLHRVHGFTCITLKLQRTTQIAYDLYYDTIIVLHQPVRVCADCSLQCIIRVKQVTISHEMSWLISEWRNQKRYNIQTVKISNFCSLNLAPF